MTEKLKSSDDEVADPLECLDSSMMNRLRCAVSDVLLIANGAQSPIDCQVDGVLRMLILDSCRNDDQFIERSLPADFITRKYTVDQFMAFTKNLCRDILLMVRDAAAIMKEKRLYDTERKNEETVRTKERLELEECNRKLKEVEEELGTFKEEVDKHRVSRIELQEKLIEAQNSLIEVQGRKLSSMSESVQKQLQGYSKVLVQNCSAAIAPSRLQAAIKKVQVPPPSITEEATPDRKLNLVLFGLQETTDRVTEQDVKEVFEELNVRPVVSSTKRVGEKTDNRPRPVIVTLERRESLLQLLRNAKQLRESKKFSSVFLSPDLTPEEQRERKTLVDTVKALRRDNPNGRYWVSRGVIKCG